MLFSLPCLRLVIIESCSTRARSLPKLQVPLTRRSSCQPETWEGRASAKQIAKQIFGAFHCNPHEMGVSCPQGVGPCLPPWQSKPGCGSSRVQGRESLPSGFPVILPKIQGEDEKCGFGLV